MQWAPGVYCWGAGHTQKHTVGWQNCDLHFKPVLLNSIWLVNVVLSKKLLSNCISAKGDAQILSKKSSLVLVTVLMKIQSKQPGRTFCRTVGRAINHGTCHCTFLLFLSLLQIVLHLLNYLQRPMTRFLGKKPLLCFVFLSNLSKWKHHFHFLFQYFISSHHSIECTVYFETVNLVNCSDNIHFLQIAESSKLGVCSKNMK